MEHVVCIIHQKRKHYNKENTKTAILMYNQSEARVDC